ncbi:hypothetical protein [Chondromyces crocatus]|uniref:Lipoprotein n=1 Tax=Chondromyces crocatus TaxID=52 RepID=A0A0K1EMN6_CHOCO|nr:hypothetical protein [Chondromyces crocatus]AKT41907.1 uncharacterized protein CMC5_061290 [Chondromyces crocatus]
MRRAWLFAPLALAWGCAPAMPPTAPAQGSPTGAASGAPAPSATPSGDALSTPSSLPAPHVDLPPTPPTVTGTIGGKPFSPKAALNLGGSDKGRVLIGLTDYATSCDDLVTPVAGNQMLTLQIEWKAGQVAFGADPGNPAIMNPTHILTTSDPGRPKRTVLPAQGSVQLVSAPEKSGSRTRIKLDLATDKDSVKGEIDLQLCWDVTSVDLSAN